MTATVLGVASFAFAQSGAAVSFRDLPHTPVGNAVLRLDASRDVLEVISSTSTGGDGVAVGLGGKTTSWSAQLGVTADRGLPIVMTWGAIADKQRISTASMKQSGHRFDLTARFTGAAGGTSTYAAHVYNNGKHVGSLGAIPPTGPVAILDFWCQFTDFYDCGFVTRFANTLNGECEWDFLLPIAVPIKLPNGVQLTGNEIRLVEEVRPAGHYPYLYFDGIVMQSNAGLLTLFAETVK